MIPLATVDWRKRRFVVVVGFIGDDRQRFVVVRHRDRGWELPGGGIEAGESPSEAARREWAEETGLGIQGLHQVLRQDRGFGVGHVFEGRVTDNQDARPPDPKIVETRFVRRLADVAPLAFPDDPYAQIGRAVGRDRGAPRADAATNDP